MASMISQTVVLPNRPNDYLYDTNYTVAGPVDHQKAMARARDREVMIQPNFQNMFSSLRHYPALEFKFKMSNVDPSLGSDRRPNFYPVQVTGADRYKYFKRPVMPYMPSLGGQIVYAKRPVQVVQAQAPRPPTPVQKTVGVQTVYRESEAQTDPYSPEYIFQNQQSPPELLALATLTYGAGLPAGMAELEMIERARVKRAWEQKLPVVTDEASFQKRLEMMEAMELREWQERDLEIQKLQKERLKILQQVIERREAENQISNDERISRIWQNKMQEREVEFQKIEKKRIKALRMLAEKRSRVEPKPKKRDIIQEYSDFGSRVYAPKQSDGKFMDAFNMTLQLSINETNTYMGLMELEQSLPPAVTQPKIQLPQAQKLRSTEARKEKHLLQELDQMSLKIQERKESDIAKKQPNKYAVRIEKPPERPATPSIDVPREEDEEMHCAAVLLQKLLRGRIVQNQMFEGKERRLTLINEVRNRYILRNEPRTVLDLKVNETPEVIFEREIQSEYVGKQLDFLTKELVRLREERRIAIMVKLADRTRRMREAEESGRRQLELKRRHEEDTIFRQVMNIHHETVDTYLEDMFLESVDETSTIQAREQVKQYADQIAQLTRDWETPETSVGDVVSSFLLPFVERQVLRNQGL
ncbi:solute carrier, TRAMD3 or PAT1-domain-containing protein [Gorgonomyces haynaldii]|nr:solute carrier, TRAMD3 or PAT1-domain-containing protein [Gorgonomyces haynaldii]